MSKNGTSKYDTFIAYQRILEKELCSARNPEGTQENITKLLLLNLVEWHLLERISL